MNKTEKQQMVEDLHRRFETATVAILVEYSGLDVGQMTELRQQLRGAKAELKVVKNTMAMRATDGTALFEGKSSFSGPIAVTLGYADPVEPARIINEFAIKQNKLKVKLGVVEGRLLDPRALAAVAKLPKREVLLAQIVGQLQAPISGWVWCLEALLQEFAGVLTAIKDKKQEGTTSES